MAFETDQWAFSFSCVFLDLRLPSGFILPIGEGVFLVTTGWIFKNPEGFAVHEGHQQTNL